MKMTNIKKPLIVIGNNKLTDIVVANALGVGFTRIYSFGEDVGRKYPDAFFNSLHPHANIYSGPLSTVATYGSDAIIDCTTLPSERGTISDALFVTSTDTELHVGTRQACGTDAITVGGIGAAIAVDTMRKACLDDSNHIGDQYFKTDISTPKRVLAIGAGGIGNYFSLNSSQHDVRLVDFDTFEKHNAHRQMFCKPGMLKAQRLSEMFPHITADVSRFDEAYIAKLTKEKYVPEVIVGCVDNPQTRNVIRDYALDANIPYFDGGVGQNQGQIYHNPQPFKEFEIPKIERSCAYVHDPSIVIPNCIIGLQLANIVHMNEYKFTYESDRHTKLEQRFTDTPDLRAYNFDIGGGGV